MNEKLSDQNVKISQVIEFEAIPFQHTIRLQDGIPDGVTIRVLLLFDETKIKNDCTDTTTDNIP